MIPIVAAPIFDGDPACAEIGGDEWFPEKGEADVSRAARLVCRGCEVQTQCLIWALDNGEEWGIWGGLTRDQRRRLVRNRRRAA